MEIALEKDAKTARIKISLREEDYQPKVKEKLKEYSRKASIKGFRPGKVPPALIEKMYGKSIKVDEINHLVSHSVNDYIRQNKLNIVGDPLPAEENRNIDWENQKEFEVAFNVGLVPEFSYTVSDKIKETRYLINVDDKVLDETIENLKSQFGEMIDAESVEEEDFITGEVKEVNGEFHTESTMFPLSRVVKGEKKKFTGKKPGDKVVFDIKKTFEDHVAASIAIGMKKEETEKKEGDFELTIKGIRRRKAAELNQELFDKVFGKDAVKNEAEFREKLKVTIEENYRRESEALLTRDIEEHLVEKTKIELPDEFLKRWLEKTNEGKFNREQIEKDYDRFSKELKWNLIRNKIVEDNELKVENEEITAKAKEMIMQQFGNLPMNEEMNKMLDQIADNYLRQDNGKNYLNIYEQVMVEKALAFIKEKIKIEEKKVSIEEFKKIAGI